MWLAVCVCSFPRFRWQRVSDLETGNWLSTWFASSICNMQRDDWDVLVDAIMPANCRIYEFGWGMGRCLQATLLDRAVNWESRLIVSSESDEHLGGTHTSGKACRAFNQKYPCDRLEKFGKRCIFAHVCSGCGGHHSLKFCPDSL
jgi:hypothetical protein